MAADNYRFAEGDSLLCYHGPMLYEAKCLKRRKASDGKAQYFIHYKGWNSKWEEWVDDNRVLSVNAANMNKMASLKEIHSNTKKSGGKRSITIVKEETIRNVVTPPIKGKKRKHSEISSELNQISIVPSPTELKPKKRGRPPKINTSKIEETEVTKSGDTTLVSDTDVITDSAESIEENKVTDKITKQDNAKKQDTTKKQDTAKKQNTALIVDIAKKEDSPKKENALKKYNATKKENTLKKYENPMKEVTLDKDVTPKKESSLKKEDTPKKENAPKKDDAPKIEDPSKKEDTSEKEGPPEKEDTPEKVVVIKATDESTEEILDTKKVEVIKNIEAGKDKKEKIKTADEEIKAHAEVENATEEIVKTKVIESCEGSKDIEETETIKEVEGSETVERNEDTEDLEGEDFDDGDPEWEDIEGEDLEGEDLEDEDIEGEDTDVAETTSLDDFFGEEERRQLLNNFSEIEMLRHKLRDEAEVADTTFTAPAPVLPKIIIPDVLRRRIAFDFQMVVNNKRFVKFSKNHTVERLIQDFEKLNPEPDNSSIGLTIIQYFNAFIHTRLLYPQEKKCRMGDKAMDCLKKYCDDGEEFHCSQLLYPRKLWHLVYGPSYLIRLFVLLPEIVASYSYIESDTVYLVKRFEIFMKFVANNFDKYFSEKLNDYCK